MSTDLRVVVVMGVGGGGVAKSLSDTSEVIFAPILGEPLASQLDDTLMHQPGSAV